MTQTFNNQVMFGHREWSILSDNNTPLPVGPDNQPLVDKPLIKKNIKREPSDVGNVEEDSGIVGYMGDDEDIEQAKYNVMSLISDKIGGLDNRLEIINQELSVLIGSNERDISELRSEFVSEECTPFLISKCDEEQTYEGCSACANYWRGQKKLPESCNETGIHNHCSYHNTYINQASPDSTVVIGSPGSESESIKVGTAPSLGYECDKLGHFDCNQIITENVSKYQNNMDTICLWDIDSQNGPLTNGFNVKPGYREENPAKCRRRCVKYTSEDECKYNTCIWSSTGLCVENVCENRLGSQECTAIEKTDSPDTVCGYEKLLIGETEEDRSITSLFEEWSDWFGLRYNRYVDGGPGEEIICMKNDGSGIKHGQGHLPSPMKYNRDYCERNVEYDNSGTLIGESDQYRGTVVNFRDNNIDPSILYRSNPIGVGANNVTWKNEEGQTGWKPTFRTETGSVGRSYDILPTCRNKFNINRDVIEVDGTPGSARATFYCDLYSYNQSLSSPDNPCSSLGGDIRVNVNASPGEDNSGNTVADLHPEDQNAGCQAKDKGMVNQLIIEGTSGSFATAQQLCENQLPPGVPGVPNNPNNCYIGVPTNQLVGSAEQTSLSYGDNYFNVTSPLEGLYYNSNSAAVSSNNNIITHQYLDTLNTCNSGQGPKPDCRLLSGESSKCDDSSPNYCLNDITGPYEKGRCGPKTCSNLKPELGCHLGIINSADNDIKQKAFDSVEEESNNWVTKVISNWTDWEEGGNVKPQYNDTRDMIQNIETYIRTIGSNNGSYCASATPASCKINSEVITVIDNLSKLRYNSLQGELDNLWIWYLVFALISLLLLGFPAYQIYQGDLLVGGHMPDTLFFSCLLFVPIFYFGLLINVRIHDKITDNKDIYGSNKTDNCVRSPGDDPMPPESNISTITEQLNECLDPLDKLESAVGGIWLGIPLIIYLTAILIWLFTNHGGVGAPFAGRGAGAAALPAGGVGRGLVSGLTGSVAGLFDKGVGGLVLWPREREVWEGIIITICVFFVLGLVVRVIIYLFRDKITSIDTKTLDFSSSVEMFPSPPPDKAGLFGVGSAQDIPGRPDASPGEIDITGIYPCQTYRAIFNTKIMQDQLEDYDGGTPTDSDKEEMDNLFKVIYDKAELSTDKNDKSPWYSAKADYRLMFDDKWDVWNSFGWIALWLVISIFVIYIGLVLLYSRFWGFWALRASDNTAMIIGVVLFYAYSFLVFLPNLFSYFMFKNTKQGDSVQANAYYNDFYNISSSGENSITFEALDTPAEGPCLAENAFCDTRTFNEIGQDNFRQYNATKAGDKDICLSSSNAWEDFIENNITGAEVSFWDVLGFGLPSRSQWAGSSDLYKNALKDQIKFNSYLKYLKDTNRSLEDTRRETLAKEFYKDKPGDSTYKKWLPALLVALWPLALYWGWYINTDSDPGTNADRDTVGYVVGPMILASFVLFVTLFIWAYFYLDRTVENKEKAWYRIATRGYNLWKGKDYQYYLNNCGSDDSHKCIVKSAGENNINEANSIFEIKLPNGQTREADIYECDKFNGCLLSDFTDTSTPTLQELNGQCPQSGFTQDDIDQIKNLSGGKPTGECSNEKDNTPIVDLFRYYHGLPGTVNYGSDDDNVFQGIDELGTHGEEGRPSFADVWSGKGAGEWLIIIIFFIIAPFIVFGGACTFEKYGREAVVAAAGNTWVEGGLFLGIDREIITGEMPNIAFVIVIIWMILFIWAISTINVNYINDYIDKLDKYTEPDPDITENISAIGTSRSSPHRSIWTKSAWSTSSQIDSRYPPWRWWIPIPILILVYIVVVYHFEVFA